MSNELISVNDQRAAVMFEGTQELLKKLTKKTPANVVKSREGPRGMMFDYVPWAYVAQRLNEAFPAMWSFEYIGDPKMTDKTVNNKQVKEVTVHVRLITPLGTQEAWGNNIFDPSNPNGKIGDSIQGAGHIALRRAAAHWGIALDLYANEPEDEIEEDVMAARTSFKSCMSVLGMSMEEVLAKVSEFYDQDFKKISEAVDWVMGIEQVDEVAGIWRLVDILRDAAKTTK